MSDLRARTIRLASSMPHGSLERKALLDVLATERQASENPSEWAAIFDALQTGQTVHIAMKSVMGMGKETNGQYQPWKVGRKSNSAKYGVDTIPLLPMDGSKPKNKMNQFALRKRGEKVSGSHGDMAVMIVGIRPG